MKKTRNIYQLALDAQRDYLLNIAAIAQIQTDVFLGPIFARPRKAPRLSDPSRERYDRGE